MAERLGVLGGPLLSFDTSTAHPRLEPGLGYGAQWGYNWYGYDYDSPRYHTNRFSDSFVPPLRAVSVGSTPYLTGQHYEPGDGYRYPLYYNPGTHTYFYYPVQR